MPDDKPCARCYELKRLRARGLCSACYGRTPKSGGRELDGRTWDQYPEVRHGD